MAAIVNLPGKTVIFPDVHIRTSMSPLHEHGSAVDRDRQQPIPWIKPIAGRVNRLGTRPPAGWVLFFEASARSEIRPQNRSRAVQFDEVLSDTPSNPETGRTFLRHALRVWARENGVADDRLPDVVHNILDFAVGSLRGQPQQGLGA